MADLKIWLVRHGQTVVGEDGLYRPSHGLTDLGHQQAREAAQSLSQHAIQLCYASTLPRAIETAEHFSEPHDLELVQIAELREIETGNIFGASRQIKDRIIDHDFKLDYAEFGGERSHEFVDRVQVGITLLREDALQRGVDEVAAFLHGGTIAAIIDLTAGQPFDYERRPRMPNGAYTPLVLNSHGAATGWERWETQHLTVLT